MRGGDGGKGGANERPRVTSEQFDDLRFDQQRMRGPVTSFRNQRSIPKVNFVIYM